MSTAFRAAATVGRVIAWASVACALLLLVALGIGPRTGSYRTLTVLTGSMEPAIAPGSVVIVTPQSAQDIRVGQILTYQVPVGAQQIVTHRVVSVRESGSRPIITTKGDANSNNDPWSARIEDPEVWRVRSVVPGLGRAIVAARSPFIRVLTVWLLPFLLAGIWIKDLWRKPKGSGDEVLA